MLARTKAVAVALAGATAAIGLTAAATPASASVAPTPAGASPVAMLNYNGTTVEGQFSPTSAGQTAWVWAWQSNSNYNTFVWVYSTSESISAQFPANGTYTAPFPVKSIQACVNFGPPGQWSNNYVCSPLVYN